MKNHKKRNLSEGEKVIETLINSLQDIEATEEKIRAILDFMGESLSQNQSPQFKEFWEARKLVLPLFKEKGPSFIRSQLWKKFVTLTAEGRRLKEVLDEQSSFAVEQIELALEALEKDLQKFSELVEQIGGITFPKDSKILLQDRELYQKNQSGIELYSTFAQKLQALRKEVLQTDMRMRKKNDLFKKMSVLGDEIFPKRKEKMKEVSEKFSQDVEKFIADHTRGKEVLAKLPYYLLLEEIKSLQAFAKELSLTPEVFTSTRKVLSEFWDTVKELEKEKKKEILERREQQKVQMGEFEEKIEGFTQKCEEKKLSLKELEKEKHEIEKVLKGSHLSKKDQRHCLERLKKALEPFYEKMEKSLKEQEEKKYRKKNQAKLEMIKLLEELPENLEEAFQKVKTSLDLSQYNDLERLHLEHLQSHIEENIQQRKKASLQQLEERVQQSKDRLELYKKALASSNLDFSRAFFLKEMLEEEKKLMDSIVALLEEEES